MYFKRFVLILTLSLCVSLNLFAGIEKTSFLREDGSQATAYISTPDNTESFPLVVYIDGSFRQSVESNFSVLSYLFDKKHIAVAAVEKRGITSDSTNLKEFDAYDSYENRLNDYIHFIYYLDDHLANWNGQIIFIGSSEGGKIAPKLTLYFAPQTMGTIMIGSGGGIPFGDEMKYQIKNMAIANHIKFNEKELDRQIDAKYAEMLSHPSSLKKYYDKTYQWFASLLKYDMLRDLLCINTPILVIQGSLDTHIPPASGDAIKAAFDAAGKENLDYIKYSDLGHSISQRPDIFMLLLLYSAEHFESPIPAQVPAGV